MFPNKEEFADLPEVEQKKLVQKTKEMLNDLRPLNRAERRAAEKNKRKLRRQQEKEQYGN